MYIKITGLLICVYWLTTIECGEHFRVQGRIYYSSYPDTRNWYQAKRFCTYQGMYLVDVRTDDENKRILSVINQTENIYQMGPASYWTSGTRLGDNNFYWDTTGHPMLYTNWATNQPDSNTNYACIYYSPSLKLKWSVDGCDHKIYFICRDTFDVPIYKAKGCTLHTDEL